MPTRGQRGQGDGKHHRHADGEQSLGDGVEDGQGPLAQPQRIDRLRRQQRRRPQQRRGGRGVQPGLDPGQQQPHGARRQQAGQVFAAHRKGQADGAAHHRPRRGGQQAALRHARHQRHPQRGQVAEQRGARHQGRKARHGQLDQQRQRLFPRPPEVLRQTGGAQFFHHNLITILSPCAGLVPFAAGVLSPCPRRHPRPLPRAPAF